MKVRRDALSSAVCWCLVDTGSCFQITLYQTRGVYGISRVSHENSFLHAPQLYFVLGAAPIFFFQTEGPQVAGFPFIAASRSLAVTRGSFVTTCSTSA